MWLENNDHGGEGSEKTLKMSRNHSKWAYKIWKRAIFNSTNKGELIKGFKHR